MEKEIDIGTFFVPMHEHPVFRMIGLFGGGRGDAKNVRSHI
ncbi:MAG: hypothetical protein CHKLHMKO_00642 [Candidatus Argoarchaeum ethanivorans]|uniref:Uncharacterized protein n=1 Tax=Candidatus Argoarchaeum ethanivorans TaxID=2608793 RepID=A0A811TEB1_9EURY|nr:MAG: hypothetical protein CHKLHMKO_00642 [Candidatus Argoarchaeum ethanivorans]